MYEYRGTIVKVTDGDTMVINVDLGFRIYSTMTFRLYGINTPETIGKQASALGKKAKLFVQTQFPVGTEVTLTTHKDSKEKYGRYLAEVIKPEVRIDEPDGSVKMWGTTPINQILLELGLAKPYFGEGEKPV